MTPIFDRARRVALTLSLALLATAAVAETPRDTLVMALKIDDIITLDPAWLAPDPIGGR